MPATVVQNLEAAQNTGLATVTVNHSAATAGNLLILVVGADDYRTTVGGGRPESSGYTLPTGGSQQTFLGHYVWYKVATGGETSVQYTIGSASPSCWEFYEVSGLDAAPYDTSNGQLAGSSATTYTTPAITPSAGERWLFASIGGSLSSALSGVDTWINSFVELNDTFTTLGSGTRDVISGAERTVTADGVAAYSTGATYSGAVSPQSRTGIILSFKVAAAGSSVNAGEASGIGTALAAAPAASPAAGAATGAGTAHVAGASAGVNATAAAGSGTAHNPSVSGTSGLNVNPAEAAGTGTAYAPAAAGGVRPTEAAGSGVAHFDTGSAISLELIADDAVYGTGIAYDATASTASAGTVSPAEAAGTGTAYAATPAASAAPTAASGVGTAYAATAASAGSVAAGEASGSGVAYAPTGGLGGHPTEATGVGAAYPATLTATAEAAAASGAGTAYAPALATGGPGMVPAEVASGSGFAYNPRTRKLIVRPFTGTTARPYAGVTLRP